MRLFSITCTLGFILLNSHGTAVLVPLSTSPFSAELFDPSSVISSSRVCDLKVQFFLVLDLLLFLKEKQHKHGVWWLIFVVVVEKVVK